MPSTARLRGIAVFAAVFAALAATLADDCAHANYKVLGRADRDQALYAPGETMTFTLDVQDGDKAIDGLLAWTRSGDDGKVEEGRARVTPEAPLVITTTLDTPGFVWVRAPSSTTTSTPRKRSPTFRARRTVTCHPTPSASPWKRTDRR